jgi:DNA-binding LytR/AlgR family response regulator
MTEDRPLEGKRSLVLEDDFYLASDETALLERAGATVVGPFESSCTGKDIESAGKVDGAIVDINLGRGPTFDFARVLQGRGTPFVFVTGYDAAAIPNDLSHAPRIEKPVRERDLVATLTSLLADER